MCDVLNVSRSGYYSWRNRSASQRKMADAEYIELIKQFFDDSRQTYGYESIWRNLRDDGVPCGKHRTRRLMRQEGLVVKQTKRYERTTKANQLISDNGGSVKSGYALLGETDLVLIVDFPSVGDAMKASVGLSKLLGIGFSTAPAVSMQEFDQLVG